MKENPGKGLMPALLILFEWYMFIMLLTLIFLYFRTNTQVKNRRL
jgi:hypothetical protein